MPGLKYTMGAMDGGNNRRYFGTAFWDGSKWWAKLGDDTNSLLDARWLDPIQPVQGGKIVVDVTNDGKGQSSALVIGGYTDQPRPSSGTVNEVIPAGVSTRLAFTGEDGASYTTDRFSGTYSPGDAVNLMWAAGVPTITGKIAAVTTVPEAAPPPPPSSAKSGETKLSATASDTFGVGGWGRWATSRSGGEDVYAGTWAGYTLTGSWFYGAPRPELAGKTITRILFKVPARLSVGASGTATIHAYAHTSGSRPGGDVNRVTGPFDIPVPQGYGGGYTDLPLSFAPTLVAGGGISIAGDPYVGFQSRLDNPEFGKLIISWSS